MNAFFIDALQHYGYPALWLIVFFAAAGAPISGSLLLFAAGAFAALGDLNIIILFPVALSAAVMGDNLTYFIGRRMGRPLLAWIERQKRFRWISPQALARGQIYFRRRGAWAIFITRFLIVVLGGPINLLAGLEKYPFRKFLLWDVCGQILSVIISLGLGYVFAASWEEVASLFGAFSSLLLIFLVAVVLAVLLVRKVRQHKDARTAQPAAEGTPLSEANPQPPLSTLHHTVQLEAEGTLPPIKSQPTHTTTPLPLPMPD
ncbi:MAG TPA: DedA family protein [Ktedonobacteraceae bacterium]|nr:DedA family protein [Ktedonobacteraceae bacterium]